MEMQFNVSGEDRKRMVKAIERELGVKAKYLGVPSCSYQIGDFVVTKDGTLSWEDDTEPRKRKRVVDACTLELGGSLDGDTETEETTETEEITEPSHEEVNVISVPKDGFTKEAIDNIFRILESKKKLFCSAFQNQNLTINVTEYRIEFPWFPVLDERTTPTYTRFVTAICEMAKNQKRITAKPREDENEKYAFRCFLLRLGFIGNKFKEDRKLLLANLDGSSAFKHQRGGTEW